MTVFSFALLASAVAAWHVWHRLQWFLRVYQRVGGTPFAYRAWLAAQKPGRLLGLRHAAGMGVLVGLALTGYRAPVATAVAACVAWALVFVVAPAAPSPSLDSTDSVRRQTTVALLLASLPVVAGLLLAWQLGVAGVGVLPLLGGWLAADAGAPLWVWAADRSDPLPDDPAPDDSPPALSPAPPLGAPDGGPPPLPSRP